ncbi:hypothetical protein CW745_15355 [Psychromonas sp. psych-6C06]|uniref:HEPN domain-containing protein n=1 Tax=Psychromonas sp. psych-6C06 TaxID=2058089 RepID=UPI000C34EA11|nr:HEPN domain-containing protein [Psychromonas sp. psych-6C06]PKF60440.1 hypothetical protein CW745_15355 [Psychromonas sp. psych-6C06]
MKVEYLIIVDSGTSFCKTKQSFKSFLQSDSDIKISGRDLSYKKGKFKYELQDGENSDSSHKFFHIKLYSDEKNIENFSELSRSIKRLLHINPANSIQTLWDDVSFYYSNKSYPIVYELENLMRKLITKFMLTTVGLGWTKETIPEELKKSSRATKIDTNNNYLYETDFIQLSNFLFDEYRTLDISALIKKISELTEDSVQVSEISDFIPKSNWERYFQESVDCEGDYLKNRWEKLYKLRCKIAHNNAFGKSDFEQTSKLASEVKTKLDAAIQALDTIHMTEEDREDLVESVAMNSNVAIGAFIQKWKLLERLSIDLLTKHKLLNEQLSKREKLHSYKHRVLLIENKLINATVFNKIQDLNKVRNVIVHEREQYFTETEIKEFSKELDKVLEVISDKCSE